MNNHTPCLLVVDDQIFDNDGAPETVICGTGPVFIGHPIAVAIDFKNAPGMREANARRLVASWNVCDGLSTENLENNTPIKEGLQGLNAQLRAARAPLGDAVKPHNDHVAAVGNFAMMLHARGAGTAMPEAYNGIVMQNMEMRAALRAVLDEVAPGSIPIGIDSSLPRSNPHGHWLSLQKIGKKTDRTVELGCTPIKPTDERN